MRFLQKTRQSIPATEDVWLKEQTFTSCPKAYT